MYKLKKTDGLLGPAPNQVRLGLLGLFLLLAGFMPGVEAQGLLPEHSSKYRVTRQVFDRLAYVYANTRPQPQLEIIARHPGKPRTIALYKPGHPPLIQLDEEVYDLCRKLGKDSLNALAVLLSHELAHHYEKHDWYYTFGIGQTNPHVSKENIQQFESEADFYGCFYGELAGYASGRVFPLILDLVYQRFQLAAQLPGYPTREERKATYAKKQTEALQMVTVFKAGKFLYLLQEFDAAAQCFEYLVNRFPSREILNNLSAAKLQQALVLYTNQEQPDFVYPVELDGRSRLMNLQRSAPAPGSARQLPRLLSDARKYAEKAREIDPGYVPAYINLACIYSLQGNQAAAIGVINELGPSRITPNAYTIRAIAYYKDNQPGKAGKDFEAARQQRGYLAQYNLALFRRLNETVSGSVRTWITSWLTRHEPAPASGKSARSPRELIGGKAATAPLPASARQMKVGEKPYLALKWEEYPDHSLLGIQTSARNYQVLSARESYPHATARKVRRGTHSSTLLSAYGEPSFTYPGALGEYWVYQPYKIAFELDKQNRVCGWMIFARTL